MSLIWFCLAAHISLQPVSPETFYLSKLPAQIQSVEMPTLAFTFRRLSIKGKAKAAQETWLCTYRPKKGPAEKFELDMFPNKDKGTFVASPNSPCQQFIQDLAIVLEAKYPPKRLKHKSRLPFDAINLGTVLSKIAPHVKQQNSRTGWEELKLFFGDDEGEMFMNVNRSAGKGEFSLKDPDYGDYLISQFESLYGKR